MSLEKFIETIKPLVRIGYASNPQEREMSPTIREDAILPTDFIWIKWRSGGMSGGSCWGTEHYALQPDSKPEFDSIDTILENVNPNITFLQYKKLMSELAIDSYQYTIFEYYGNYSEFTVEMITIENLYNVMLELGLINGN